MKDFDVCFNLLIMTAEGSTYVNNPHDSGGPTRWGITKKVYEDFYHREASELEIEDMLAASAKQIYTGLYWLPLSCDKIQDLGFKSALFTSGVLYGIGTIAKMAQRALISCGVAVKLDGNFGDKSAKALNDYLATGGEEARDKLMKALQAQILNRIAAIIRRRPKDEEFRDGWTKRTARLSLLLKDEYFNQYKREIFT